MGLLTFRLLLSAAFAVVLGLCMSAVNASSVDSHPANTRTFVFPDLYEASIVDLQDGMKRQRFTSADLVKVSDQHHCRIVSY